MSHTAFMTRVLMLNNEFPPLGGGTGSVNQAILDRLAKMGCFEIDLVTSARGRKPEQVAYADHVRIFKVPVNNHNIHHSTARELSTYAWLGWRQAARLHQAQPYDVCMTWSTVPAGWIARRLSRRFGLPYIVRVTGPDIPGFEKRYRMLYPFLSPVIKRIWNGAEVVVVKCAGEARMVKSVAPEIELVTIHNGVELGAFAPARCPHAGEPIRLVCVGRLIKRKGQDQLIEAVARLRELGHKVQLDLVGTGDEEDAFRRLALKKNVQDQVVFSGYVSRDNIAQHYASAHLFVLPSDNEGMSVSTLEAMASGLPLVVSRTGGTEELVEEGVNGMTFSPGDRAGLVKILCHLAGDPDRMARMGHASLEKARQFSWDEAARRYLEIFKEIGVKRDQV